MATTPTNSIGSLDSSQFLQLLVAQIQYQDPLNPTDSSTFTSQLAQLQTLQTTQQLNANFSDLLTLQQLTGGSSLIGKTVSYQLAGAAGASQGVVSALSVQNGQLQLTVNNTAVPLSQVLGVQ